MKPKGQALRESITISCGDMVELKWKYINMALTVIGQNIFAYNFCLFDLYQSLINYRMLMHFRKLSWDVGDSTGCPPVQTIRRGFYLIPCIPGWVGGGI